MEEKFTDEEYMLIRNALGYYANKEWSKDKKSIKVKVLDALLQKTYEVQYQMNKEE